ncbi:unnamed protein product [Soboliphyme baturini]|uniref:PIG-H domain-containing protein n=1 Tax=Soboliphyme baturini TaxID=241478 RepID=A0A183J4A4_9BILA|nr:unnamed protein product [Soboliphyme baturini]
MSFSSREDGAACWTVGSVFVAQRAVETNWNVGRITKVLLMVCCQDVEVLVALGVLVLLLFAVYLLLAGYKNRPYPDKAYGTDDGLKRKVRVLYVVKDLIDIVYYFGPSLMTVLRYGCCEVMILSIQPTKGQAMDSQKSVLDFFCKLTAVNRSYVTFAWNE